MPYEQISSPRDIQAAYRGSATASGYVEGRFASELMRLMHDKQVAAVNRAMKLHRPLRSLEIAPGPGRITREVITSGSLTCLEFNDGMIEVGRPECSPHVTWVQGDAFALPFQEEFELAYTFRFVRHFKIDDRARLYAQVRKVLRPGGVLLFDVVNEKVSAPLRKSSPEEYPVYDEIYANIDAVARELKAHGLLLVSALPVLRCFSLQRSVQLLVGPRWRRLCRSLIRGMEWWPGGPLEWIVECRRE